MRTAQRLGRPLLALPLAGAAGWGTSGEVLPAERDDLDGAGFRSRCGGAGPGVLWPGEPGLGFGRRAVAILPPGRVTRRSAVGMIATHVAPSAKPPRTSVSQFAPR